MAFEINMNPLVQSSQNVGNAFANAGGSIADAMQANQQQEQQGQFQELIGKAVSGDPAALEQVFAMDPDTGMKIAQKLQGDMENEQAGQERFKSQMAQDTADAVEQLHLAPKDKQEDIFNAMVDDERYDIDDEDRPFFMDEGARKALVGKVKGKEYADNLFGKQGADKRLPAEAVAFNDLIKDFTPAQQKTAKLVKAGLKGRAISNAELSAIESGAIKSYSDYKTKQKQAEKFAEATGSSRARIIDQGFNTIVKIDGGIRNIDKALAAVESGAGVGAVEKLWPSIKASSVELDNVRGQMALDVVGATTFGALSKGELDLAKDIALPTGLDTAELKDYLERKKTAQEKLRNYYNEQIQFLDQGGTVAGFLRSKERESQSKPDEAGTQKAPIEQQAQALPDGVTDDDINTTMKIHGMTREQVLERLRSQ